MQTPSQFERPPRRPLKGWVWLLPVVFAVCAFAARTIVPPVPEPNAGPAPRRTPPASNQPVTDGPTETPKTTMPTDTLPRAVTYVFFLPGADGKLHRKEVPDENLKVTKRDFDAARKMQIRDEAATRAVRILMSRMSEYFPPQAKLLGSIESSGGKPKANFNRAFAEAELWSRESDANMALAALVNTAIETRNANIQGSDEDALTILIEGKPIETLGEFDVSDPIEPDMSLVATS